MAEHPGLPREQLAAGASPGEVLVEYHGEWIAACEIPDALVRNLVLRSLQRLAEELGDS